MKSFPFNIKQVLALVAIAVFILVIADLSTRMGNMDDLKRQVYVRSTRVFQLTSTSAAMETQIAYAGSPEGIEEGLRKMGLLKPGEIRVVPLPDNGATPVPAVTQTPLPTPVAPWQIWWALFFGR
jgi:hypothetical protein